MVKINRNPKKILYLLIFFLAVFFLVFQLRTEKLVLPPVNSFKLVLDYNSKLVELTGKEKDNLYNILKEVKIAWRPLESTPSRFISGDTISILAREGYNLNIIACPYEDTLNGLKTYAFIRSYKGINDFDRIIINSEGLIDYLKKLE